MSGSEGKPMKDRVTDLEDSVKGLEESVQSFTTKMEHGGAKADFVGATAAATGASAEFTGFSTGVKLWSAELDIKAELEKRQDRNARRNPEKLRLDLDAAQSDITRIKSDLTGLGTRTDQRFTDLSTELNRKIARKADLSAVQQTADRQGSQLEGLRSSQVSALRREAAQANANVQQLNNEIARLNARF